MRNIKRIVLGLVALSASCLALPILSAQTATTITVKSGPLRQSFSGFGASQADRYWNDISTAPRNTMADMVYHDLKANVLRMWVTTSDSITVSQMLTEFNNQYIASGAIADIKARGVTTLLLAPAPSNSAVLPGSISTYATNLAEFILQVKNTYGVTINVTGICNEPEPTWTAANIVTGITTLRSALDSRGLTGVQIIAPESSSPGAAADTIPSIAANSTAWNAISSIASHSYDTILLDDKLDQLKNGKSWWTTEAADGSPYEYAEDEDRASSIMARFLCEVNHGSNQWLFFIGLGQQPDISNYQFGTAFLMLYDEHTSAIVPFLKYYYFKQALNTIDPGAVFRKCLSSTEGDMFLKSTLVTNPDTTQTVYNYNPAISAAAAYNPDGSWGINVVNETGITAKPANPPYNTFYPSASYNITLNVEELAGSGTKTFNLYRSKSGTHFVSSGTVSLVNGVNSTAITVGPKEMISLRSAATAAAIPPVPTGVATTTYNAPVMVTWNNTVKATSWKVKRSTTSGGPYTLLANTTTTSCGDWYAFPGTTYYYVISAVNASGESANSVQVSGSPAPSPWWNADIGTVGFTGNFHISDYGIWTINSTGLHIGGYGGVADSFNFTYRPMTGDGTIVAHLIQGTQFANSNFGISMREDLTTSPKSMGVYYDFNTFWLKTFMWTRSTAGGSGSFIDTAATPPTWFKITRAGNVFTGYSSANGSTWTTISSASIPMASTIYVGLSSVCSSNSFYATSVFDNVSVTCLPPTALKETASPGQIKLSWTASSGATSYKVKRATSSGGAYTTLATIAPVTYTDTTAVTGTNYYYKVCAVNALGDGPDTAPLQAWWNTDIGTVGISGSSVADGSTFNTTVAGANIADYAGGVDSYNLTYRKMTGNGTIIARMVSGTHANGRYGIVMTEGLGTSERMAGVLYDYNGYWLRNFMFTRTTAGGAGLFIDQAATPPTWFKLVRAGNLFTGYGSPNGTTWTQINSATIPMNSTIYVGLIGMSSTTLETGNGTFDNVTAP